MDQAALYDRTVRSSRDRVYDEAKALLLRDQFVVDYISRAYVCEKPPLTIAELSIGDGRLSRALLRSTTQVKLTCVDISLRRNQYVKELLNNDDTLQNDQPNFVECNFDTQFDLLPSGAFDAVVALDIMEHVIDVFCFMENCYRLLKPSGVCAPGRP